MSVPLEILQDHINYSAWATARLLEACAQLSPEELSHDFRAADSTIPGTLAHVYGADRIWLSRVEGLSPTGFPTAEESTIRGLQAGFAPVHEGWKRVIASVSPAADIKYADMKGRQWQQPLWQIVLHLVNHATHHRGQVSGFLRALGHTPPNIDLVYYQRRQ
jgi:uncharacterized damage-inducible protein DinB